MADQQDFEALLPKLGALDRRSLRKQDMPLDQAIKEGEIMAAAAMEDVATFTGIGFDTAKISELSMAVGALRFAQARLIAATGELKEASRQWDEEEPMGYELRADMLAAASYALRDVPNAMKAIKRIREGSGGADMIQDLIALSELGKKYLEQMKSINYDVAKFDSAAQMADALGGLYAKAFVEKSTSEAKDLRDRAFTYMRKIMSDVLHAAEYVFRKDPERLSYYHSAYRSRQNAASDNADSVPASATPTQDTVKVAA
jgi:hypothetical protein